MKYIRNVRIAFNRLGSALVGFDSLMPLSAGFYAHKGFPLCKFMVHMLDSLLGAHHCMNSWANWAGFNVKDESIWKTND